MPAVHDWTVPFTFTTPQGEILFNQFDPTVGAFYNLVPSACSSSRETRADRTNRAQSSGEILHPHFSAGYVMTLKVTFWERDDEEACDDLLQTMADNLEKHVNAILGDFPVLDLINVGRIQWSPRSPEGGPVRNDRMLDGVRTQALPAESLDADGYALTFQLLSQIPYAWDAPETDTDIAGSGTVNLHNPGTANFYPVIEVHGPSTAFTIINHSVVDFDGNPLKIVYDSDLPGANPIASGHDLELVFFNETAYLDRDVADYKAGIDPLRSDFWTLQPGDNLIEIDGASCTVKWQAAWA